MRQVCAPEKGHVAYAPLSADNKLARKKYCHLMQSRRSDAKHLVSIHFSEPVILRSELSREVLSSRQAIYSCDHPQPVVCDSSQTPCAERKIINREYLEYRLETRRARRRSRWLDGRYIWISIHQHAKDERTEKSEEKHEHRSLI